MYLFIHSFIVCFLPSFYIKYIFLGPKEMIQWVKSLAMHMPDDQNPSKSQTPKQVPAIQHCYEIESLRQKNQTETCGLARYNMTAMRQKTSETRWKEKTDISKFSLTSTLVVWHLCICSTHTQMHTHEYIILLRDNTYNLRYHTFFIITRYFMQVNKQIQFPL